MFVKRKTNGDFIEVKRCQERNRTFSRDENWRGDFLINKLKENTLDHRKEAISTMDEGRVPGFRTIKNSRNPREN